MSEANEFLALLQRVRQGDQSAAAALIQQYEPFVRRAVRYRLTDPRLRRTFDSMDVCQSVLGNFLVRMAAGQFKLETPEQLIKLLATMAHHRILNQARRQSTRKHGGGRPAAAGSGVLEQVADRQPRPSQVVAAEELLQKVRALLTPEEQDLMDRRARGEDWAEIAAAVGGSPDRLRMRLGRALNRVTRELGLDEVAG